MIYFILLLKMNNINARAFHLFIFIRTLRKINHDMVKIRRTVETRGKFNVNYISSKTILI